LKLTIFRDAYSYISNWKTTEINRRSYVIRKKEIESRNQILKNPVKLKHLQELVSMSLGVITAFVLGMWCFLDGISLCLLLSCLLPLSAMHHIYTCLLI